MEINQPFSLTIPIEVSEGGTGVTSFVPYAIIVGGTTATGPLQQVSGLGTMGYVLTSNGVGTLPSWQVNGNGTVSTVSVVSANGFAGTVANPTTTPAITLSTTITGILQGNGTAISAATTGNLTDVGTDGITIGSGTGAVLGSGTTISQHVSDSAHNGYLSSTDWSTFNGKQNALGYTPENVANKTTDFVILNDTLYPSVKAVNDAIVNSVIGLLDYRGSYNASSNLFPSTGGSGTLGVILKGDFWICSVAGTLGGVAVTPGDLIISITDTPGQTASNWDLIAHDLGSYVTSVSGTTNRITTSATTGAIVVDISASYVGQSSITTLGTIGTGVWQGTSISTTYTDAKVVSVSGTANRITSTGGETPVIDISASYVGQSSITTLGTITTGVWTGNTIAIANGGTGQITKSTAFDALSPMTALGDVIYGGASGTGTRLAGNTTTTRKFLRQTGDAVNSAAPAWDTVTKTDVGLSVVENTALSTWAGSANITTLGTVSSGTWNGSLIIGTYGGTGVNNGTKTLTYLKNISFTAADDTGVYTLPTGTKTLAAAGAITSSGITMSTARLLGRTTASTGAVEEITVVSPLSLASTNLTTSIATSRIVGRTTAGSGVMEQLTVTAPLTLSAGALGTSLIAPNTSVVVGAGTTTTGTIVIDSGATFIMVEILAPGGGGGAGRRGATSTNRFGGNGGNGGSYAYTIIRVADLGTSTIYYSLGKYGAGAIGQTGNDLNGANGSDAEDVTLQKDSAAGRLFFYIQGGKGGLGGSNATQTQTAQSTNGGSDIGGVGGASQTGVTASGVGSTYYAGQGGGCGQSISSGNANSSGALTGGQGFYHTASSNFSSFANSPYSPGGGASGGAINTTGNSASTGGLSNVYGAGGGGGGASLNGTTSGGGGDGSPGVIRVLWW